jgi:hypothetical protein
MGLERWHPHRAANGIAGQPGLFHAGRPVPDIELELLAARISMS